LAQDGDVFTVKEIDIQSMLIKNVILNEGYGHKSANPHIGGLPDIFVAIPGYLSMHCEVKIAKINKKTFELSFDGTALQKECLRKMKSAGHPVCWILAYPTEEGARKKWTITAAHPTEYRLISPRFQVPHTTKPEAWPMADLIRYVQAHHLPDIRTTPVNQHTISSPPSS
jgi:hypothetical protein